MNGGTIADRHVHPATVPLRFLKEAPSTLLGLPAAFAYLSDVGWATVLSFAASVAVVMIFVNWIIWSRFRYGVGPGEIVIEKGLLHRTRRSIPFERIQDVDIERGPLQRLFGLAKVKIETGGSGKDEGLLDSVTLAEADRLRGIIRAGKGAPSLGAEEVPRAEPSQLVFAMDVGRVFVSGLFNFSLLWIAGLFALLQTFDDWLPFDIYDPGRWVGLVDQRIAGRFSTGAILAVLLLALLLGVVTGVARTLARDFGFRLTLEGERFRRERGLFTRTEAVIPRRRVQLARLQTGPLRRLLGWFQLYFQTLSAGKDGGGHQAIAPLANQSEVAGILEEQGGFRVPDTSELTRVSSRHLVRTVLPPLVPILVLAILFPLGWALLAALPPLVAVALLERRFHRYGLLSDLLFVRRGVWRQQLWIVPVAKVQSLRLSRSWLQRRLGLATLAVDTAGAPAMNAPRIVDVREDRAQALAAEIAARLRAQDSGRKSGTER
ncbi:PH domain-containing protein [Allosphingosinicella sp.]|uniref:PH domain-containing protein n=1 Tax=Allosphingosinicella sp. TaxID=2823234 RepID=UPI002FC1DD8B